jgi:hypothetical protein
MDAWDVLRALKAGEISVADAKKQLTQPPGHRPAASGRPTGDFCPRHADHDGRATPGGAHRTHHLPRLSGAADQRGLSIGG